MTQCPCGSDLTFDKCCEPFLSGAAKPATAEQMMRARYTAHTCANIDFVAATTHPQSLEDFDAEGARRWAEDSDWMGLEINNLVAGSATDSTGTVEFTAHFRDKKGTLNKHSEVSLFEKVDGEWRFSDAQAPDFKQVRRDEPKVGRNDPCPCGSGKKNKKCCGRAA
ncbi:MAG: SEC-C motif-containing protein [Hyphomicrobiaceae bacterium]|jgi:SEC-C motif-containing protein